MIMIHKCCPTSQAVTVIFNRTFYNFNLQAGKVGLSDVTVLQSVANPLTGQTEIIKRQAIV